MSFHRSLSATLAALCLASPLAAQTFSADTAATNVPAPSVSAVVVTPTAVVAPTASLGTSPAPAGFNATVGMRANAAQTVAFQPQPPDQGSRSPAMMIVGGAALLVGAIVGGRAGTIVMITGGVIGLVGLWNFLQ